jgi:hypothetical protein
MLFQGLHFRLSRLINSIWNKEELPDKWKESTIASIHKKGDSKVTAVVIVG